jgi:hypothetical protein
MFDIYSLKARLAPMLLLLFPFVILGITFSIDLQNYWHLLTSLGIVAALTLLLSEFGRELGKKKEKKLWKVWGGEPVSLTLRLSTGFINANTKARYHAILLKLCPVKTIPTLAGEKSNAAAFDSVYASWGDYLRNNTRDKNMFPLVFKELVSYGFRRNLWGLKTTALIVLFICIVINCVIFTFRSENFDPAFFPFEFWVSSSCYVFMFLGWILMITRHWVRTPAFEYAKQLCASSELLNK